MAKALMDKAEQDEVAILQTSQNTKVLSFDEPPEPTEYVITHIRYQSA